MGTLKPYTQFKNLGITHYLNDLERKIDTVSIESQVEEIHKRKMSWRAKAINLDIFGCSKVYFILRHEITSKHGIKKLQKIITNGIRGSLRHEIRQNILFLPPQLGGIGLPNIQKKICTAKLCDMRNILFNGTDPMHSKKIQLQFEYNTGILKQETISLGAAV